MQVDVGAYIADLLYEHDSVNIPGLGGLVANYKSATIDQVQGKIHPPSKDLNFNDNLVVNDGLLVNFIKEKHQLSYGDALRIVEEYVREIKEAIGKREIVVFPNVGRLYMDYEKNLQFLPDNTNFNTDVYGLPTVQFYPVIRSEQSVEEEFSSVNTPVGNIEEKGGLSIQISKWFQKYLPYIVGISFVIVGLGFYFMLSGELPESPGDNLRKVSDGDYKINVSPSKDEDEDGEEDVLGLDEDIESLTEEDDGEDLVRIIPDEEAEEPVAAETEVEKEAKVIDTEEPSSIPGKKVCKIVVGSFGSKANVDKLVEKIYEAGFEPYTEKAGSLTRVGVQLAYDEESETRSALRTIRRKFDKNAKIVEK